MRRGSSDKKCDISAVVEKISFVYDDGCEETESESEGQGDEEKKVLDSLDNEDDLKKYLFGTGEMSCVSV